MSHQFAVVWSKAARTDLFQTIQYIRLNNPKAALNALQKIREKALELVIFPEKGRIVPELQRQGIAEYRELIVSPWRIIYNFTGSQVVVLSVLDSRRNLEDILLQRLLDLNHENPLS